jgi:COP9 signalosome complex subunit 6
VKDVHKVPALDLVGWYTMMPISGPQPIHLPLHREILQSYNESAILLGFHPTAVLEGSVGGKLPLTIYESNYEAEDIKVEASEDKEMKDGEPQLQLKFKELPYTVETGEAEMISVDFVARGGGNATAVDAGAKMPKGEPASKEAPKGKTRSSKKSDESESEAVKLDDQHILSREDEELIASLTAKANAIKMLHSRVNLIAVYLQNLPPSYVSGAPDGLEDDSKKYMPINHAVLRSVQALLGRLSLLIPADAVAFEKEMISEQNDVGLVSLLNTITQSINDVRETGRKYSIVDHGKGQKKQGREGPPLWANEHGPMGSGNGVIGVGDLIS